MAVELSKVRQRTRNAVESILEMVESGETMVGQKRIKVRNFAEAKRIKVGKLYRCMGHVETSAFFRMKQSVSHRIPNRHMDSIMTWHRVINRVMKLSSVRAARKLVANVRT